MTFRRVVGTGFAVLIAAGALPLAACGGGGGEGDDVDFSGVNVSSQNPTPVKESIEQVIEVKDNSFSPDSVTIKAGTKVIWKWSGTSNPHSIQLTGTTSPEQTSGEFTRTFDQSGTTFSYQCGVHKAAMTGRIVVE